MPPPCLYQENDDKMNKVEAVEEVDVFFIDPCP
jgi:hypothetical protein